MICRSTERKAIPLSARLFRLLAVALLAASAAAQAQAPAWPSRPVRIQIAFAAGGLADVIARAVTDRMSQTLGQITRAAVTCVLRSLDWDDGRVELDVIRARDSAYVFPSAEIGRAHV